MKGSYVNSNFTVLCLFHFDGNINKEFCSHFIVFWESLLSNKSLSPTQIEAKIKAVNNRLTFECTDFCKWQNSNDQSSLKENHMSLVKTKLYREDMTKIMRRQKNSLEGHQLLKFNCFCLRKVWRLRREEKFWMFPSWCRLNMHI